MLLVMIGLLFAVPLLWAVSVGAVRDARRARGLDPRSGCQAWVAVPGLGARRYRCGEQVFASTPWCRRHARAGMEEHDGTDQQVTLIDEHQAVGRALVQARIGVPLAVLVAGGSVTLAVWALQRAT